MTSKVTYGAGGKYIFFKLHCTLKNKKCKKNFSKE
jgi:hypothetical protein